MKVPTWCGRAKTSTVVAVVGVVVVVGVVAVVAAAD